MWYRPSTDMVNPEGLGVYIQKANGWLQKCASGRSSR